MSFEIILTVGLVLILMLMSMYIKNKKFDTGGEVFPYKKNQYILSLAEKKFYEALDLAIKDLNYYVCFKVRLADIVSVDKHEKWQSYFNKISAKHIDFLICDKNTLEILFAIELDDKSHGQKKRQERDYFVDNVFKATGLDLIRFKPSYSYSTIEIRDKLGIATNSETK